MAAYGLYTHIQSNKRRSIALLIGLFFVVYVLVFAVAMLAEALSVNAPLDDLIQAAVYDFVKASPFATIGDKTFSWKPRDILVAPSWAWRTLRADTETVLFSFSDRPMQEALDLFRQEQGRAA